MTCAHSMVDWREARGWTWAALGVAAGAVYVCFDLFAEAKLEAGTLTGTLGHAHSLVDHSFPLLAGGLLGVCLYQLRWRARLQAAEQAAERAEALRIRLQKVERDQAVWVLAAAVLHELNNPLHALGLLLDEFQEVETDATRRAQLLGRSQGQISRALSHLAKLRSMHGMLEPEPQRLELQSIVQALVTDMEGMAREQRVELHVSGCAAAQADASYVRTILENLLDNSLQALRTESSGGRIQIQIASEPGHALVRVADDGPALSSEVESTLFDPLRSTKAHGLGLGLPIARALARAMRGDLVLEPGKKSFCLQLPLGAP